MSELTDWLARPIPRTFPYTTVLGQVRQVGKHFTDETTLKQLALARETLLRLETAGPPEESVRQLQHFLDVLLDKWDGCYDYRSYTALALLQLPGIEDAPEEPELSLARRDRLVAALLADALGFELAAEEGRSRLLPEMRPGADLVAKRYRLGLRVATPTLERLGLRAAAARATAARTSEELAEAVKTMHEEIRAELSPLETRMLQLSLVPVYVSHDEYLFLRVLQVFETTFAMLVVQLRSAVDALRDVRWQDAAGHVAVAARVLTESAPVFSLLATMQVESFRTFREFTEGASAIQSRNYKLLESLCRIPDEERLDSAAYRSAPEVRDRVRAGQQTLEDAYRATLGPGPEVPSGAEDAVRALRDFGAALRRWRQTHYRLAVRMLGTRSGTGYTEGTPYLSEVRKIPVFTAPELGDEG
ncbi:tryptophan 2,3-dioxygenase family protein [Streptomyces avermitilis]|uniref:tryptophan 2,3-dioxygenase family protein n=1 Tax=Streptomyces avermitilis TaxID=33903 RepID=UPI00380EB4AC